MQRLSVVASHLAHHPSPTAAGVAAAGGHHVLVVGGTGLIGRSAAEHFLTLGDEWNVTTVSRRALPSPLRGDSSRHTHLALDLCDANACVSAIRSLPTRITHLIYAAMGTTPVDADPSNGTAIDVGNQVSPLPSQVSL